MVKAVESETVSASLLPDSNRVRLRPKRLPRRGHATGPAGPQARPGAGADAPPCPEAHGREDKKTAQSPQARTRAAARAAPPRRAPPVSAKDWWAVRVSNPRPSRCKRWAGLPCGLFSLSFCLETLSVFSRLSLLFYCKVVHTEPPEPLGCAPAPTGIRTEALTTCEGTAHG